jgi:hypothetical protein
MGRSSPLYLRAGRFLVVVTDWVERDDSGDYTVVPLYERAVIIFWTWRGGFGRDEWGMPANWKVICCGGW